MSDLDTPIDTSLSAEEKALEMGWAPKDRWRGDPEKWVDAETFVKKGEEVLPILRHNNQQLLATQGQLRRELEEEKKRREEVEKTVKDLAAFQAEEVQRQVKEKVKDLRRQIREARDAGDAAREDALMDELEDVRTKPATPAPTPAAAPATPAPNPHFDAWLAQNPWYAPGPEQDLEKVGLADGIAMKVRKENPLLDAKAFYNEVDKRLAKFYQAPAAPSKVEGGGGGGSPSLTGKGYSDLPAEAKAVCDKQASLFVGEGKLYKTVKEWQAHYAELVFGKQ